MLSDFFVDYVHIHECGSYLVEQIIAVIDQVSEELPGLQRHCFEVVTCNENWYFRWRKLKKI